MIVSLAAPSTPVFIKLQSSRLSAGEAVFVISDKRRATVSKVVVPSRMIAKNLRLLSLSLGQ